MIRKRAPRRRHISSIKPEEDLSSNPQSQISPKCESTNGKMPLRKPKPIKQEPQRTTGLGNKRATGLGKA